MSQIMKTFLGVFLIMFMVVTSSGVLSGFMTVVEMHQKPEIHWSLNCI